MVDLCLGEPTMSEVAVKQPVLPLEVQEAWNRLNPRQRTFCIAYFETSTASEAYRKAGFKAEAYNAAAAGAWKLLNKSDVAAVIHGMLEAYKLNPQTAARKLSEALEATETRFFAEGGQIVAEREVVDWPSRLQALDMLNKILGLYKQQPSGVISPTAIVVLPKQEIHVNLHVKSREPEDGNSNGGASLGSPPGSPDGVS